MPYSRPIHLHWRTQPAGARARVREEIEASANWVAANPIGATILAAMVCILAFVADMDLMKKGLQQELDAQVIGRSLYWYGLAAYVVVTITKAEFGKLIRDTLWWCVLAIWLSITAIYSITPLKTFVSASSLVAVIIFMYVAATRLGIRKTSLLVRDALLLFLVLSIVMYYVDPMFGHMVSWIGTSFTLTDRMSGIAAQPNTIGSVSGLCILLTWLFDVRHPRYKFIIKLAIPAFTLFMSDSRTPMIILLMLAIGQFLFRRSIVTSLATTVTLALITFAVLTFGTDELVALVSRSGKLSELTTMTGRTYIWELVWEMFQKRPIFGYGYNTTIYYLPLQVYHLDPRGAETAPHAHNLVLQLMFCGGSVALVLFVVAFFTTVFRALQSRGSKQLALFFFSLLFGLTEPATFGGSANTQTIALGLALACVGAEAYRLGILDRSRIVRMPKAAVARAGSIWRSGG